MHVRQLRDLATKISRWKCENADLTEYFYRRIHTLCKAVLKDCCIELKSSAKDVERAASSADHASYLAMHRQISNDVVRNCQTLCSSSAKCTTETFLAIVPHLIQNVKEIFVNANVSELQNGLRGLPDEAIANFVSNVQEAQRQNRVRQLVCEVCKLLEQLCLNNCGKQPTPEIEKWGRSLAILTMLDFLRPFFQNSLENVRLHKRLELFSGHLRDIVSDVGDVANEVLMRDFSNVALSLFHFAKFDPSKLVRFELKDSTNSPVSCQRDTLQYDKHHDKFSQRFDIRKESDEELQLQAVACVHVDGQVRKIGAFQLVIMLSASGEEAFNKCMTCFCNVEVTKLENKDSDNFRIRVVLCSTQKEKLSEVLCALKRDLSEDLVDLKQSEITQCYLAVHTVHAAEGAVVSLRLIYIWRSEAVSLDSKDFLSFAAESSLGGACIPQGQLVGKINFLLWLAFWSS